MGGASGSSRRLLEANRQYVPASSSINSGAGHSLFEEKKHIYEECPYLSTQEVADNKSWGAIEIEARQVELARYAPKAWPL